MKEAISPRRLLNFCLCLAAVCWSPGQVLAATITVSNTNDNGAGSLRQAIQDAASGDTINFSVTGTIFLTSGELLIAKDLNIVGPGATNLSVSGSDVMRVIEIGSNVNANILCLTIRDGAEGVYNVGNLTLTRCSISNNFGSGIYNVGVLTLNACIIKGNSGGNGGGINNSGNTALNFCTVDSNHAWAGAGLYNAGTLTLIGCTVSGNGTFNGGNGSPGVPGPRGHVGGPGGRGGDGGAGGGICNSGMLRLTACTISGNFTGDGGNGGNGGNGGGNPPPTPGGDGGPGGPGGNGGAGAGVHSEGTLTFIACTVSGNFTGHGGNGGNGGAPGNGAASSGPGGKAGDGGDGAGVFAASAYAAIPRNALVALNSVGPGGLGGSGSTVGSSGSDGVGLDVFGPFASQGHNLVGRIDGSTGLTNGVNGDQAGTARRLLDPKLGPLQDNGGPTLTLALLPHSPAIDTGDDALLLSPLNLNTDQRGFLRKFGPHVDIGAFELQPVPPSLTGPTKLANGQLGFTLMGEAGRTYTIQSSTNLVNWVALTNFISPTGTNQITDTAAPNFSQRFYRAVTQ